jgi:hypothetical protein
MAATMREQYGAPAAHPFTAGKARAGSCRVKT